MEDSLFLFLGGLGTSYTRENPPEERANTRTCQFKRWICKLFSGYC